MKLLRSVSKLLLLVFILNIPFERQAFSQIATPEAQLPKLDEIRVPSSPAFNIMGISPTAVNRPSTPREFTLTVINTINESDGNLPSNFALEFAPYWWVSHPELTFEDYYSKTKFGQFIPQSLSISIAGRRITNEVNSIEIEETQIAIGIRFSLLAGEMNPELSKKVEELKKIQLRALDECVPFIGEGDVSEECLTKLLNQSARDQITNLDKSRVGWQLEFASAALFKFPQNDWDNQEFNRFGAWLTAGYRPRKGDFSQLKFLSMGRYIFEDLGESQQDIYDMGFNLSFDLSKVPLSLSAEYVHRFSDNEEMYRAVCVIEYLINENYSLFASYGRAFDNDIQNNENLISMIGINIGLGNGSTAKFPLNNP